MNSKILFALFIVNFFAFFSCNNDPICDTVIQNGTIYDGSGLPSYIGSLAMKGDKIIYVGPPKKFNSKNKIDATGKAVSPGFINMLSWGYTSLL